MSCPHGASPDGKHKFFHGKCLYCEGHNPGSNPEDRLNDFFKGPTPERDYLPVVRPLITPYNRAFAELQLSKLEAPDLITVLREFERYKEGKRMTPADLDAKVRDREKRLVAMKFLENVPGLKWSFRLSPWGKAACYDLGRRVW